MKSAASEIQPMSQSFIIPYCIAHIVDAESLNKLRNELNSLEVKAA
jgi:hypothetical protein